MNSSFSSKPTADPVGEKHECLAGRVVLVADDHAMLRLVITRLLKSLQMTVIEAKDGREAIDLAKDAERVDIAILDLAMPVLSGFQAASEIRKLPSCAEAKLIALSGAADMEEEVVKPGSPFDGFLLKPCSFATITEALISLN